MEILSTKEKLFMSLFKQWSEQTEKQRSKQDNDSFWMNYLEKEKENYIYLLEHKDEVTAGMVSELSEKFNMDTVTFAGFIDGINSSLVKEISLEDMVPESEVELNIDYEKLYYNMLEASADWLYNLEQWEDVLSAEKRQEIKKDFNKSRIAVSNKVGRNDPCPCGSGKKYKKCCG